MRNLLLIIALVGLNCLKSNAQTFYGLTTKGGSFGYGTLFKFDKPSQKLTVINSFNGKDGAEPSGTLLHASNGILYGTTTVGGSSDQGTLFQYDPQTGVFATLANFEYTSSGAYNFGSLTQLKNGDIVGVCSSGGVLGYGTIWKYSITSNKITKLKDFDDNIGAFPYSGVMQASNGKLYGLTSNYGPKGSGSLYEFNLVTNTFALVQAFNSFNGAYGIGEITEINGKLFGLTFLDGANGMGTIFDYNLSNSVFTTRYSFNDANGGFPYGGGLSYADNGLLYGTTSAGGQYDDGTLFSYNPQSGSVGKVFDFNFNSSGVSYSPVVQAADGNLYGMTERSYINGVYGYGSIFQYDFKSSTYTTIHHFDNTNGGLPSWIGLTEFKPVDPCSTDNIVPLVVTKNITIHLSADGTAKINASQIDNGSSDNCTISSYSLSKSSFLCSDVGKNKIFLTVTDGNGNTSAAPADVTIVNEAPVIKNLVVPVSPINISQAIKVDVTFTDENIKSGFIAWGDGTSSAGVINGESMTGNHNYIKAGIFGVSVSLTDACLLKSTSTNQYVIIYDLNSQCLSGEGQISSAGNGTSKENNDSMGDFKIEVGYRGNIKPVGKFEFTLGSVNNSKYEKDDDHHEHYKNSFKSTSFDWLIINGKIITVQGVGKVNGNSGYSFVFSAVDVGSHADKLRVRIWNQSGVVYDNDLDVPIYAEASKVITDGHIRIYDCDKDDEDDDDDDDENDDDDEQDQKCKIDFFPNPITTHMTVTVSGGENKTTFNLVDYRGRHVDINPMPSSVPETHSFDLHDLPSGVYLLTIRNGSNVSKKRILKD